MTVSTTLLAKVNGGAALASQTVADGDTIQLTVTNKDGWGTAYWQIWYYKDGYALPSGWTEIADDADTPAYQVIGRADPPTFDADGEGGTWTCKVIVTDTAGVQHESEPLLIRTPFDNGLLPIGVREQAQFGGAKASVVKTLNFDIEELDGVIGATLTASDVDPTPDTLCMRGPSGEGKFTALEAASLQSQTADLGVTNNSGAGMSISSTTLSLDVAGGDANITLNASNNNVSVTTQADFTATAVGAAAIAGSTASVTATSALTLTGSTAELKSTTGVVEVDSKTGVINAQRDGTLGATITVHPTGAFSIAPVAGATSVTYQQAAAASGIGVATVYGAQAGFAGSIGGYTQVGANNGGTPGTNLAGGVRAELGTLVTNQSAKLSLRANGTEFAYLRQQGASSETILSSLGALDLDSATSTVNLMANGSTSVVWTLSASGAVTLAPVGGAASLTVQPSQKTSGAGAAVTVAGGQGASGSAGGKTTIGADNAATPGTQLGGGVDIELGATVGGTSAPLTIKSGGNTVATVTKTSSATCEISNLALIWVHGASGCLIGSNDDTVRVNCDQSNGFVTAKGTNGGVRLQDTSVTWCEVARVAAGRNVVGLAVGANLDTTKMPTGTGNGVVFLGNCATAPTAVPNNSGCGIFADSCQVKTFANNNAWTSLTPLVSAGYTKVVRESGSPAPTTQASTSPIAVVIVKTTPISGLSGIGTGVVRIKGYRGGDEYIAVYQLQFKMAAGTLSVIGSDVLGTARGTAPTSIAFSVVSTDIVVTITPANATSTKWSISFDWEFDAVT